jgi:hypothetical protein
MWVVWVEMKSFGRVPTQEKQHDKGYARKEGIYAIRKINENAEDTNQRGEVQPLYQRCFGALGRGNHQRFRIHYAGVMKPSFVQRGEECGKNGERNIGRNEINKPQYQNVGGNKVVR